MRDLTVEELALAPDWARHYQFGVLGNLIFLSLRKMLAWNVNVPIKMTVDLDNCSHLICSPKPIPRKQFDITQHEWSDGLIEGATVEDECLFIDDNDYDISTISINKADAIAIAKHFKLTGDDIK